MNRSILIALALALVAPAAMAHDPPGPVVSCQSPAGEAYHDYIPPVDGYLLIGGDGNLADCGFNEVTFGVLNPAGNTCKTVEGTPAWDVLCVDHGTGQNQPIFDYDGEYDYGHGGLFLAVVSGDGTTSGADACFGMQGHHSNIINAWDTQGFGPAFTVTADYSRVGEEDAVDCGDSFVEPCDPTPPPPSTSPPPVNIIIDTINAQLYALFGPGEESAGCNPRDNSLRVLSSESITSVEIEFPAGADGAYAIFLENDYDSPRLAQAGHIWTS